MKTNFMKVSTWAMALCASMAVFTACNSGNNGYTVTTTRTELHRLPLRVLKTWAAS